MKYQTIKSLWIGEALGSIEQLSLKSFLVHGHAVELFTYGEVQGIPDGVRVRDAREILSEDQIFKYKKQRSYAGFANWFRYAMLYKEGGVWIDADVVCLKPFDFEGDLFFGYEQDDAINCAVVGATPGLPIFKFLMKQVEYPNRFLPYDGWKEKRRKLYRYYIRGNQRGDLKWGETGPRGFTKAIHHFGLLDCALPAKCFFPIHASCWNNIFDDSYPTPEPYFPDTYAIHLWNEMARRKPGFDKEQAGGEHSLIAELKRRYLD